MAEWLSYPSTIDGKTAYVDFDASLDDPDYRNAHPYACELVVSGFPTDESQLPTDGADDMLFALEQRLEAILAGRDGDLAVMTACDGDYTYVAYSVDDAAGSEFSAAAREAGLTSSVSTRRDPQWESYRRWALTGEDLETTRDKTQLDELSANGVDLSEERDLYFDFEFHDAASSLAASGALAKAGFTVVADEDVDLHDTDDDDERVVQVELSIVPTADAVGDIRRKMTASVAPFGATFLGWGCDPDL